MAFDATVLCGALLKPNGLEFELLRAAQGFPFRGFTTATEVVGMEFLRNAHMGFGAGTRFRRYDQAELADLLDAFEPLFDPDNVHESPVSRALTADHSLHDKPIGEVYELTGKTDTSLLSELEGQPTVTPGPLIQGVQLSRQRHSPLALSLEVQSAPAAA